LIDQRLLSKSAGYHNSSSQTSVEGFKHDWVLQGIVQKQQEEELLSSSISPHQPSPMSTSLGNTSSFLANNSGIALHNASSTGGPSHASSSFTGSDNGKQSSHHGSLSKHGTGSSSHTGSFHGTNNKSTDGHNNEANSDYENDELGGESDEEGNGGEENDPDEDVILDDLHVNHDDNHRLSNHQHHHHSSGIEYDDYEHSSASELMTGYMPISTSSSHHHHHHHPAGVSSTNNNQTGISTNSTSGHHSADGQQQQQHLQDSSVHELSALMSAAQQNISSTASTVVPGNSSADSHMMSVSTTAAHTATSSNNATPALVEPSDLPDKYLVFMIAKYQAELDKRKQQFPQSGSGVSSNSPFGNYFENALNALSVSGHGGAKSGVVTPRTPELPYNSTAPMSGGGATTPGGHRSTTQIFADNDAHIRSGKRRAKSSSCIKNIAGTSVITPTRSVQQMSGSVTPNTQQRRINYHSGHHNKDSSGVHYVTAEDAELETYNLSSHGFNSAANSTSTTPTSTHLVSKKHITTGGRVMEIPSEKMFESIVPQNYTQNYTTQDAVERGISMVSKSSLRRVPPLRLLQATASNNGNTATGAPHGHHHYHDTHGPYYHTAASQAKQHAAHYTRVTHDSSGGSVSSKRSLDSLRSPRSAFDDCSSVGSASGSTTSLSTQGSVFAPPTKRMECNSNNTSIMMPTQSSSVLSYIMGNSPSTHLGSSTPAHLRKPSK